MNVRIHPASTVRQRTITARQKNVLFDKEVSVMYVVVVGVVVGGVVDDDDSDDVLYLFTLWLVLFY